MPSYIYTNFDNETVEVEISEEIQAFLEADGKRVNSENAKQKDTDDILISTHGITTIFFLWQVVKMNILMI